MNTIEPEQLFSTEAVVREAIENKLKERGRVNVLIAGKTGVGKSTLINAVFNGNYAETGQGRPVTKNTFEYKKQGIPLHIYDTVGLELADFEQTLAQLDTLIATKAGSADPNDHIHCAWICILEAGRRVEAAEQKLVEVLANRNVPVIAVITKASQDDGFRSVVRVLLPRVANVVRVRAINSFLDEGQELKVMGLDKLVELTMEVVPAGQKNAFAAAQKVSIDLKVIRARTVYAGSATIAGGIAAAPIPFSAAAGIVPIHISMLTGISAVFGLPMDAAFLGSLVSSTVAGVTGTIGGRAIVGGLLLLLPGAGVILNGVINGGTAAMLTAVFGEAYIQTLVFLIKENPNQPPSASQIAARLKIEMAKVNPFMK